jgi:hypothetical protein
MPTALPTFGRRVVFHLLANLPQKDPTNLGIHARFWMQVRLQ